MGVAAFGPRHRYQSFFTGLWTSNRTNANQSHIRLIIVNNMFTSTKGGYELLHICRTFSIIGRNISISGCLWTFLTVKRFPSKWLSTVVVLRGGSIPCFFESFPALSFSEIVESSAIISSLYSTVRAVTFSYLLPPLRSLSTSIPMVYLFTYP